MDEKLASLLIDLSSMTDEEADRHVFEKYVELYLDKGEAPRRMGVRRTHDGEDALFTESRYKHAFGTSSDKVNSPYANDVFVRSRGERVAWIGPVIAGECEGTQCWLVPPKNGDRDARGRPPNRLYVVGDEAYVVWLEPRRQGGWWFSSAYVGRYADIRRYCRLGRQIWAHKKPRD
jgi:hypothetical protein